MSIFKEIYQKIEDFNHGLSVGRKDPKGRRGFLKKAALAVGSVVVASTTPGCTPSKNPTDLASQGKIPEALNEFSIQIQEIIKANKEAMKRGETLYVQQDTICLPRLDSQTSDQDVIHLQAGYAIPEKYQDGIYHGYFLKVKKGSSSCYLELPQLGPQKPIINEGNEKNQIPNDQIDETDL